MTENTNNTQSIHKGFKINLSHKAIPLGSGSLYSHAQFYRQL